MNLAEEFVEQKVINLLVSSPPPAPPPPRLGDADITDNVTFYGLVLSILFICHLLIENEEWVDVPWFQLIGAASVTLSYMHAFVYGSSASIHSAFVTLAIMACAKHLAIRNELQPRMTNVILLSSVIPGLFLVAYKAHAFHLADCASMRSLLVLASLLPIILLMRTLRDTHDKEHRILRFRLIGLYFLVLVFHMVISPRHMCETSGESAIVSTSSLLFDLSLLAMAHT